MSNSNSAVRVPPGREEPEHLDANRTTAVPSFAELYATYFSFIWSVTRYLGVARAEVDDVVQEIFVIIHKRMHTIEKPESLRSWIYSIVRRTVSRYHRTKRTTLINTDAECGEPETLQLDWCTPHSLAEQSEQVALLQTLLNKLDAPKREVFLLVELEGMTAPEIAAAIEVPLNTVYSRLRAARQELDEALQRHHAATQQRGRTCLD
jgi:RNA polymerase sigma-70 factor (ECF subfamily)